MVQESDTIEKFLKRSHPLEKAEDERAMEKSEPVPRGDTKEVYRGLRRDFLTQEETDPEIREIFRHLSPAERVVNTWIYTEDGIDLIKQDEIPYSFHEVLASHGPEYVIKEAVEVFEDITDHGYIYCDLKPENLRFNYNGKALAIDYLDEEATEPLEAVDTTYAAAKSYDLFTEKLVSSVENLNPRRVEKIIDKHSRHVETDEYTGDPLMDFSGLFPSEE